MINQNENSKITIGVNHLKDLFLLNSDFTFSIPDFQRPYVWDEHKIETLFKDIVEEQISHSSGQTYYMGAILLHQKAGNCLEIIDGQQRITTLLILDFVLNKNNSLLSQRKEQLQLFYNSPKSKENIIHNERYISSAINTFFNEEQIHDLLEKLIFTVIVTRSKDDAFVFFDTQNNRGVKLSAVDFLKSYHLKALKGEQEETGKQKLAAKTWDKANQNKALERLFQVYLWRGRTWKGRNIVYENKDKILAEFQKKTRSKPPDNSITLFANNKNRLASSIQFSPKRGIKLRTDSISLNSNPIDYPFSFRQPIEKGMNFFLFTEKYNSLHNYIFKTEHELESELFKLNEFYKNVYKKSGFSHYFTDVFELCILLYFDKFEENGLFEFVLWLDYLLGAYRFKQKSIVAQTPVKILRDENHNLLDIIDNAFLSDEIIEFIQKITPQHSYETEISNDGVQGNYKKWMVSYFEKNEFDVILKKDWIYAKLNH